MPWLGGGRGLGFLGEKLRPVGVGGVRGDEGFGGGERQDLGGEMGEAVPSMGSGGGGDEKGNGG